MNELLMNKLETYSSLEMVFINIKTQWISMLSQCKRGFAKYKHLVMKMVEDSGHFENDKINYELLWDAETCQGWLASYPIWKLFNGYLNSHICDFIYALKLAKAYLFIMYNDSDKNYNPQHFFLLVELIEHINDVVYLTQWKKPTFQVDYTNFFVGGKLYMLHVTNSIIGVMSMANKEDWT